MQHAAPDPRRVTWISQVGAGRHPRPGGRGPDLDGPDRWLHQTSGHPQKRNHPQMARLVGVDLPREKRVEVALTYIFGVGRTSAQKALAATGVNPDTRVKD